MTVTDPARGYRARLARARRARRPPRVAQLAEVDWEQYVACRVCPAATGWRCIDLILDGAGHLVAVRALDQPHAIRRRRRGNWGDQRPGFGSQ